MTTGTRVGIGATLLVGGTIAYLLYKNIKSHTGTGSVAARNADGEWEENHKTLEAAGSNPRFSPSRITHMATGEYCARGPVTAESQLKEFAPASRLREVGGKIQKLTPKGWVNV